MIRPMESRDKAVVMALIEATDFFHAHEVTVAEELVDVFLNVPGQSDYQVVVIEDDGGRVAGPVSGVRPAERVFGLAGAG